MIKTFKQWALGNPTKITNCISDHVSSEKFPNTIEFPPIFLYLIRQRLTPDEIATFKASYLEYKAETGIVTHGSLKFAPENKIPECIHPYVHGCKGCEFNEVPELSDGGCKLSKSVMDHVQYIIELEKEGQLIEQGTSASDPVSNMIEVRKGSKSLLWIIKEYEEEYLQALPYSTLWRMEAYMLAGCEIFTYEADKDLKDILKNEAALADYYGIPKSIREGGNKDLLINYVAGKRQLGIYLQAYCDEV